MSDLYTRVSMTIESGGVTTEVSREFDREREEISTAAGSVAASIENPELSSVTQAVAKAAAIAHNIEL